MLHGSCADPLYFKHMTDRKKKGMGNGAAAHDGTRRAVSLGGGYDGGGRSVRAHGPKRGGFARPGSTSQSSFARRPFHGGRSGGFSRPKKRTFGDEIDVTRFVNKAVVVEEEAPYMPTHQFSDFALDARLQENILRKKYVIPTAIQDRSIPEVLKGKDVIGIANTGEGKTAAFLLPLIHKMIHDPHAKVLVVIPTRELALQIDEEFMAFSRGLGIYSVLLVGGVSVRMQVERLRRKVRMVIGTPGRLKDLIEQRELDLSDFHHLVLDEADRMLDMGFIHDIRFLIDRLPARRHTLFFSATFAREIETLAQTLLADPVKISVKKRDTSKHVEQDVVRVSSKEEKFTRLCEILRNPECTKVLVFGRTKHGVEKLGIALRKEGFAASSIHGNKTQPQRQLALRQFKDEKIKILVATDVAARGLDIPHVSHVVNYDVPATYDDYVHRIGRTGRAGRSGVALTFVGGQ